MNEISQEIRLETKLVGSLQGEFFISSYQRGYRWGEEEVTRLLDDIYANGTLNYCLQPVVVQRKNDGSFELIDGQQRITTLYLIYKYMHVFSAGFLDKPRFSLSYATRDKSAEFLVSIDPSRKGDNIDFWFMFNAYKTIEEWFNLKDKKSTMTNINKYLDENVKIIWYEIDESEDAIALFARLNIGKIPLTSAELVKAMFLNKDNNQGMEREKQQEISLQWDNIEKELHNEPFWYFLTNRSSITYQTRIDLILDLMSKKSPEYNDKYYTFFHFDKLGKNQALGEIWKSIQHTAMILRDWFEDHELYHKIGFLIAAQAKTIHEIFLLSQEKTKKQFKTALNSIIKESIALSSKTPEKYSELSYDKHYRKISNLLLLFNIESVRQNGEQTQWFPFDKFKFQRSHKVVWSLEHIHAQQSEGMKKQEEWKEWLRLHVPSLEAIGCSRDSELISKIVHAVSKPKLERNEFESIQQEVTKKLSIDDGFDYMHSIANLALLNTSDNAALSNATFDVKRNAVIDMDKNGQYIPFCTKMIFLKYYTPSASNQLHFWSRQDREAYLQAMNNVLKDYLSESITIASEAK